MLIRNKFKIMMGLALSLLFAISISVLVISLEVEEEVEEIKIAGDFFKSVVDLNSKTEIYVLSPTEENKTEWLEQYEVFSYILEENSHIFSGESEKEVLEKINEAEASILNSFNNIVINVNNPDRDENKTNQLKLEITNEIEVMNQKAYDLSQHALEEISELQRIITIAVISSFIIFSLLLISAFFLVVRKIINSLSKLNEGAKIIGKGGLDKKIDINTKDELGELANSFNTMADSLANFYNKLENKVKERTDELEKIKSGLEQEVSTRTKEIREAKDNLEKEVADQTIELKAKVADLEKINKFMIGRELKLKEMKDKIRELESKLG